MRPLPKALLVRAVLAVRDADHPAALDAAIRHAQRVVEATRKAREERDRNAIVTTGEVQS